MADTSVPSSPSPPQAATVESVPDQDGSGGGEAEPSASSTATESPAEARRRKAQARKEKILARGNDRLAQITNTARGEDGKALYDTTSPAARRSTPSSSSNQSPAASTPTTPRQPYSVSSPTSGFDDPEEVDIGQQQQARRQQEEFRKMMMQQQMMMFGGGTGAGGRSLADQLAGEDGGDAFGGPQGPNGQMPFPFGNMFNQSGAGAGAGGQPPMDLGNLASMFGGAGGAGAGGPSFQAPPPTPKTWLDRLFPLFHLLCMVGLAWAAFNIWEPSSRAATGQGGTWDGGPEGKGLDELGARKGEFGWDAWARLGRERPSDESTVGNFFGLMGSSVAQVPLFWLFVTIELVLQTTRLFVSRNRPPRLPSLVTLALPYLPPNISILVQTASRYWSLLGALLDDLAVLVFAVGAAIVVAEMRYVGVRGVEDVVGMVREEMGRTEL